MLPKLAERNGAERLSREQVQEFLATETLFCGASTSAIERLSKITLQRVVRPGLALFSMGQACDALHFVVEGCGFLVKISPDGRQRILHNVLSGEMVGAVPFFDGKGYPATFIAQSECTVLNLPRKTLTSLLAEDPDVSLSLIGGIVGRLRMMSSKVEQMSFEDTTERLWDYLIQSSKNSGGEDFPRIFEPLPTREHIANSIGTVREVVSRRLSRLVHSGHIKVDGRRLTLLKALG
jgi:CRP/FNR family transcriptional regulator